MNVVGLLASGWVTWAAVGQPLEITDEARAAADRWLATVDTRDATGSWETAGREFQQAVTREAWAEIVRSLPLEEKQLGGRRLVAARFLRELPGGAVGQFVVFQFKRGPESGPEETVIVSLQIDGSWRVAGYFTGGKPNPGQRGTGPGDSALPVP